MVTSMYILGIVQIREVLRRRRATQVMHFGLSLLIDFSVASLQGRVPVVII